MVIPLVVSIKQGCGVMPGSLPLQSRLYICSPGMTNRITARWHCFKSRCSHSFNFPPKSLVLLMLSLIDVIIIKQQDQTTDKTRVEAGEEVSRKLVQMVSRLHHV